MEKFNELHRLHEKFFTSSVKDRPFMQELMFLQALTIPIANTPTTNAYVSQANKPAGYFKCRIHVFSIGESGSGKTFSFRTQDDIMNAFSNVSSVGMLRSKYRAHLFPRTPTPQALAGGKDYVQSKDKPEVKIEVPKEGALRAYNVLTFGEASAILSSTGNDKSAELQNLLLSVLDDPCEYSQTARQDTNADSTFTKFSAKSNINASIVDTDESLRSIKTLKDGLLQRFLIDYMPFNAEKSKIRNKQIAEISSAACTSAEQKFSSEELARDFAEAYLNCGTAYKMTAAIPAAVAKDYAIYRDTSKIGSSTRNEFVYDDASGIIGEILAASVNRAQLYEKRIATIRAIINGYDEVSLDDFEYACNVYNMSLENFANFLNDNIGTIPKDKRTAKQNVSAEILAILRRKGTRGATSASIKSELKGFESSTGISVGRLALNDVVNNLVKEHAIIREHGQKNSYIYKHAAFEQLSKDGGKD
jgi:hypothetical protein